MRVFMLARRPPQWLRVAFAALALAFALNSIAHVTHEHDAAPVVSAFHNLACGYCASFGGLADAPRHSYVLDLDRQFGIAVALTTDEPVALTPITSARPRAPPLH